MTLHQTPVPNPETTERNWYVIDATGYRIGRLATEIAKILRGKNKPHFTPHMDTGDFVIVINAEKVTISGDKGNQKLYRRHSGRPGSLKIDTFNQLQRRIPERTIEEAVHGMLPKNRLGRQLFRKLKVYAGPEHPHTAQKPIEITV